MTKIEQEKSFAVCWTLFKRRENFRSFCIICNESAIIPQSICGVNFRNSSKICENCEAFLSRSFCHLQYN